MSGHCHGDEVNMSSLSGSATSALLDNHIAALSVLKSSKKFDLYACMGGGGTDIK